MTKKDEARLEKQIWNYVYSGETIGLIVPLDYSVDGEAKLRDVCKRLNLGVLTYEYSPLKSKSEVLFRKELASILKQYFHNKDFKFIAVRGRNGSPRFYLWESNKLWKTGV